MPISKIILEENKDQTITDRVCRDCGSRFISVRAEVQPVYTLNSRFPSYESRRVTISCDNCGSYDIKETPSLVGEILTFLGQKRKGKE